MHTVMVVSRISREGHPQVYRSFPCLSDPAGIQFSMNGYGIRLRMRTGVYHL